MGLQFRECNNSSAVEIVRTIYVEKQGQQITQTVIIGRIGRPAYDRRPAVSLIGAPRLHLSEHDLTDILEELQKHLAVRATRDVQDED